MNSAMLYLGDVLGFSKSYNTEYKIINSHMTFLFQVIGT